MKMNYKNEKKKTVFKDHMEFCLSIDGRKTSDSLKVDIESEDMKMFHLTFSDYFGQNYFNSCTDGRPSGKVEYYCLYDGDMKR